MYQGCQCIFAPLVPTNFCDWRGGWDLRRGNSDFGAEHTIIWFEDIRVDQQHKVYILFQKSYALNKAI